MPASSFVSNPTSTFGSVCRGSFRSTASSVAGFSFAAQPAALAIAVSLGDAVDINRRYVAGGGLLPAPFLSLHLLAIHCKGCSPAQSRDAMSDGQICLHGLNVISSPDALGPLDHLLRAGRCCSVARPHSPETAPGEAARGIA